MSERKAYIDHSAGEVRGVVALDGRPERLIIARDSATSVVKAGARFVARVRKVEPAFASAFLDLGGVEALMSYKPDARPVEGSLLEVEVRTEARTGKLASVRPIGDGSGAPRLVEAAPDVEAQLAAAVKGAAIVTGREARRMADLAEDEVLEIVHRLPGGGDIAIEPTRALVSIDVDLGERKGQDAKRLTRQANLNAIAAAARLLRLKGLGGIVILDLVGRGHDGNALLTAARAAFSPDNPGVAIGPVGRFGTMELSVPRRSPPLTEVLCDASGRLSSESLALRLIRAIENEAQADGGARLTATCSTEVAHAAQSFAPRLAERIGARFEIRVDAMIPRDAWKIGTS